MSGTACARAHLRSSAGSRPRAPPRTAGRGAGATRGDRAGAAGAAGGAARGPRGEAAPSPARRLPTARRGTEASAGFKVAGRRRSLGPRRSEPGPPRRRGRCGPGGDGMRPNALLSPNTRLARPSGRRCGAGRRPTCAAALRPQSAGPPPRGPGSGAGRTEPPGSPAAQPPALSSLVPNAHSDPRVCPETVTGRSPAPGRSAEAIAGLARPPAGRRPEGGLSAVEAAPRTSRAVGRGPACAGSRAWLRPHHLPGPRLPADRRGPGATGLLGVRGPH